MSEIGIKAVIVVAAIVIALGARFVGKLGADNPIEQSMEQVIQKETGCEVDISPDVK